MSATDRFCPTCKGRTLLWLGGDEYLACPTCASGKDCGTCAGAGQLNLGRAGVRDCPDCEGSGRLPEQHVYSFAPSATARNGRTAVVAKRQAVPVASLTLARR